MTLSANNVASAARVWVTMALLLGAFSVFLGRSLITRIPFVLLRLFDLDLWNPIQLSLTFLVGPALFYFCSPSLLRGKAQLSRKDFAVLLCFTFLQLTYLLYVSVEDPKRHGPDFQWLVRESMNKLLVVSAFWMCGVWVVYLMAVKAQSYWSAFIYHFVLVLWLVTSAFPLLGP